MICQTCNEKEATIHYFESVDGRSRTLNLCEGCAAKSEMGDVNMTVHVQLPQNKDGQQPAASFNAAAYQGLVSKPEGKPVCIGCGLDQETFLKDQSYRCPACRDTFRVVSGQSEVELSAASKLAELQAQLDQAIAEENYEAAAEIRDQMKELGHV